jgi:hypothetical protein
MYHVNIRPQEAIEHAAKMVNERYLDFQKTEQLLLQLGAKFDIAKEMKAFIRGCKDCRIGIINWW